VCCGKEEIDRAREKGNRNASTKSLLDESALLLVARRMREMKRRRQWACENRPASSLRRRFRRNEECREDEIETPCVCLSRLTRSADSQSCGRKRSQIEDEDSAQCDGARDRRVESDVRRQSEDEEERWLCENDARWPAPASVARWLWCRIFSSEQLPFVDQKSVSTREVVTKRARHSKRRRLSNETTHSCSVIRSARHRAE
jgi:hypothetical protein